MTNTLEMYPREELWLFIHNGDGQVQPITPVSLGPRGVQLEGEELLKAINHTKNTNPLPHTSWGYLPMVVSITLENDKEIADFIN